MKLHAAILSSAVGLATALSCCSGRLHGADFADLRMNTVVPAKGQPYDVAISTDGTQVAMLSREFPKPSIEVTSDMIEVRDVQSGREAGVVALPTMNWEKRTQFYMSPTLKYCDGGKYLLAFNGPDTLYVIDARSFQIHASILVSELRLRLGNETTGLRFADIPMLSEVAMDCSAGSAVAALGVWADMGVVSLKLFDLDKGSETADLGGIFQGRNERYTGDGMAISPDGSKLALGAWRFNGEGSVVELVDTRTRGFLKTLVLEDKTREEHQLTFAGDGAVVAGASERQPNWFKPAPHGRTIRVWDFGGNGTVRTLGWPGTETYRSFGGSASGEVVFGYTGVESYCDSCNGGSGELKIGDARFTVWDRASWRAVARSPKLRVASHSCPWIQIMGSCTEFELAPELRMSANGKAILAFWPGSFPPPDDGQGAAELQVFRLP
jgi:hypothetical protein